MDIKDFCSNYISSNRSLTHSIEDPNEKTLIRCNIQDEEVLINFYINLFNEINNKYIVYEYPQLTAPVSFMFEHDHEDYELFKKINNAILLSLNLENSVNSISLIFQKENMFFIRYPKLKIQCEAIEEFFEKVNENLKEIISVNILTKYCLFNNSIRFNCMIQKNVVSTKIEDVRKKFSLVGKNLNIFSELGDEYFVFFITSLFFSNERAMNVSTINLLEEQTSKSNISVGKLPMDFETISNVSRGKLPETFSESMSILSEEGVSTTQPECVFDDSMGYDDISYIDNKVAWCEKLISLLSIKRFQKKAMWLDIGRAISKVYDKQDDGIRLWEEYSRIRNVNEDWIVKIPLLYYSFNSGASGKNNITILTLEWYARIDSPTEYYTYINERINNVVNTILDNGETDERFAELIKILHHLTLIYVSTDTSKQGVFYRFKDHRWNSCGNQLIHTIISKEIKDIFTKRIDEIVNMMNTIPSSIEIKTKKKGKNNVVVNSDYALLDGKKAVLETIIQKLGQDKKRNSIINQLKNKICLARFKEIDRTNVLVTAFENCVIEVGIDENLFLGIEIRDGKPEDFISKHGNSSYINRYSHDHQSIVELKQYLIKVFDKQELIDYVMSLISTAMFIGFNILKIFPIFQGKKSFNGKSTLDNIIKTVIGSYSGAISVTRVFGRRRDSGNADPEIFQCWGKRIITMTEPDQSEKFFSGQIKLLTGGDKDFVRTLYDDQGAYIQYPCIFLYANEVPYIDYIEKALERRIAIIPFESQWTVNASDDPEEQRRTRTYKEDPNFRLKSSEFACPFLWLCVEYMKKVIENKFELPYCEDVRMYTEKFWEEKLYYNVFINSMLQINETNVIHVHKLYQIFKTWFSMHYPSEKTMPNISVFKEQMNYLFLKKGIHESETSNETGDFWRGIEVATPKIIKRK